MRLETLVLLCDPGTVRQLELGFALGQRFSSAGTLQLGKLSHQRGGKIGLG